MGLPIPVSITNDLATPLIPLVMTLHDVVPPPPAPPVPSAPCVETPVMMMWPPGFALFQNKFTTTVLHKAMFIALDGHNCGYMLPHVSIPPLNTLTPIQIAFSSRKMAFSAAKVKANGTPIATTAPVLFPMMCCAQPVTLPSGAAPTNCLNTVAVGVTLADAIFGWVAIGLTACAEGLTRKLPEQKGWLGDIQKQLGELKWKLLLGDKPRKWLAKTLAGVLVGAAKIIFTGEGSISVSVGSAYGGGSFSDSVGSDGSRTFSVSGNEMTSDHFFGPAKGRQGSAQKTWRANGTSTTTTGSKTAVANSGLTTTEGSQSSSSTATTYDKDDNVVSTTTTATTTKTEGTPWSGQTQGQQQRTTTKPGETPKTSSSSYSGVSKWGRVL
jgi:hypothetical protein